MAISFLAASMAFRLVYDENPDRGVLNAANVAVHDAFVPPSTYYGVTPRDGTGLVMVDGGYQTVSTVDFGTVVAMPVVGLPRDRVPASSVPATAPPTGTGLRGVVWLDFVRGGGGTPGVIDRSEPGLPGMTVEALRDGTVVGQTTTDAGGAFSFVDLTASGYVIRLAESNVTEPFRGLAWLGPQLVTPAVIGAYIWIWAGFAMMLVSAGLSALPRETIEAARVDGASDRQVFWLITVPLLRPILVVVLVTMTVNVLKTRRPPLPPRASGHALQHPPAARGPNDLVRFATFALRLTEALAMWPGQGCTRPRRSSEGGAHARRPRHAGGPGLVQTRCLL
jgi:alpha-glucoside transport system permease protein